MYFLYVLFIKFNPASTTFQKKILLLLLAVIIIISTNYFHFKNARLFAPFPETFIMYSSIFHFSILTPKPSYFPFPKLPVKHSPLLNYIFPIPWRKLFLKFPIYMYSSSFFKVPYNLKPLSKYPSKISFLSFSIP